jgi:DNA-binding NarL/FixJ family response regulator
MSRKATVVLADDHPLVCSGLKAMLEPGFDVVAMVHDGNDVMATVARHHPDLVLMDLSLPGQNGLELTRFLKEKGELPRVLVVTMHADPVYADEALRAGADGFLLKTARAAELRQAVEEVLAGRQFVSPEVWPARSKKGGNRKAAAPDELLDVDLAGVSQLTDRQRQVLLLIGQGYSNQEVGTRLGVSAKAIEYHRASIRHTLAITSPAALYRIATRYAETQGRS